MGRLDFSRGVCIFKLGEGSVVVRKAGSERLKGAGNDRFQRLERRYTSGYDKNVGLEPENERQSKEDVLPRRRELTRTKELHLHCSLQAHSVVGGRLASA